MVSLPQRYSEALLAFFFFFFTAQLGNSGDRSSAVLVYPQSRLMDTDDDGASRERDNPASGADGAERLDEDNKQACLVGTVPEIKTVNRRTTKQGRLLWSEQKPGGIKETVRGQNFQEYAIIKRQQNCKASRSEQATEIHSIVIQSPYLQPVLAQVFRGYPGFRTDSTRLELEAPLECFFHRWEQFEAASKAEGQDPVAKQHMDLLYNMMKEELRDLMCRKRIMLESRCVMFKKLWALFTPGCTVITKQYGMYMAAKFTKGRYEQTPRGSVYVLECKNIERNNIQGWNPFSLAIDEFDHGKLIASLSCYPMEYSENPTAIEEELRERGNRFNQLRIGFHGEYRGLALYHTHHNSPKTNQIRIKGRIMIDWKHWGFHSPGNGPVLHPLTADDDDGSDKDDKDDTYGQQWRRWYKDNTAPEWLNTQEHKALTRDQLIYAPLTVCGYSFSNRRWMRLFVDQITSTQQSRAFDSLAMATEIREAITTIYDQLRFTRRVFQNAAAYNDKGMAILISGGPGSGKTHAAEAIADKFSAPLYTLPAGDLVGEPSDMQLQLETTLDMVWNWDSCLVVDGIDVFLQPHAADKEKQRTKSMLLQSLKHRHGMVVLFTSTTAEMDAEFDAMIGLRIHCPPLDAAKRAKVWESAVLKAVTYRGQVVTGPQELEYLSKWDLNGREIDKVVALGMTFSEAKSTALQMGHLETAVKMLRGTIPENLSAGASCIGSSGCYCVDEVQPEGQRARGLEDGVED